MARDITFSGDGLQTTDSKITAAVSFRNGDFNDDFAVARYTGDATARRVTGVAPAENATGVTPGTKAIASFSEVMAADSVNANTVKLFEADSTTVITATVSYDATARRATLNPSANLKVGTQYRVMISPGAMDAAGNTLDPAPNLAGSQPKSPGSSRRVTSGHRSERAADSDDRGGSKAPPPRGGSAEVVKARENSVAGVSYLCAPTTGRVLGPGGWTASFLGRVFG